MNACDWGMVERAVILARDTAFLAVGDKHAQPVKLWEDLLAKVQRELADEEQAESEATWQARMAGDMSQ